MSIRTLDVTDLRQRVQRMYHEVATRPQQEFHFEIGRGLALRLGYPAEQLDAIPAAAVDSFAGVGYFFDQAGIRPGETVVDLGSGSGTDSLLAARLVGPSGRVFGVDMTEAQRELAVRLADAAGLSQVQFRAGLIERLPVEDGCADVVISNGVINLAPDKAAVFGEAARVLRPGGRLALADIVTESPLPEGVTCDAALWAACIGGASRVEDYRASIERAGFTIRAERVNREYRFLSDSAVNATDTWGVHSISLLAVKGNAPGA